MMLTYSVTTAVGETDSWLFTYLPSTWEPGTASHKRTIMKMFDGLAWLMQIVLFVVLGLLVFPSHIVPVIGIGLLISAFLIFVARP
ncbi:MAG: hypothetical protein R2758_15565 [Bacteroidales bacterium]